MKIFNIFLAIFFGFTFFANANDEMNKSYKPEKIHVLLDSEITEALLEIKGPYYIYNPLNGAKVSSGILGKRFIVRPTANGIKWGQEYVGTHQLVIVPRSDDTSFLVNGIQYNGAIGIFKINEKLNLINQIDVEDYLKSTLSSKFEFPLEPEAMAAIAIAARTTAYYQIIKNKDSFWHVNADKENYQGAAVIIPKSNILQAVEATTNLILLNLEEHKKIPFVATWHEHSAGKTIGLHQIYRKNYDAPKSTVLSPLAELDRNETRWTYTISKDQFAKLFNLSSISKIDLFQDKDSSKVYAMRIINENKSKDVDFISLQKKLGKKYLKSNDFSIVIRDFDIHFIGYGKGHSAGLCLYSASTMAQNGEIAMSILSKFFPNTIIYNLISN